MNVISSPRRSIATLNRMHHDHHHQLGINGSHQKMESIGEISNETSSTSNSRQFKSSKNQLSMEKPLKKSNEVSLTRISLVVSGEQFDVSNLLSESERASDRLDRRRIKKQLHHTNEISVYPKLADQIDWEIDLQALLEHHQQNNVCTPSSPSIKNEPEHRIGYPTNDRRAMWQNEQTFAQHSFTRRQMDRSHHVDVRGGHYPYTPARIDYSRQRQTPAGETISDDGTTDMRTYNHRRESYREQSFRGRMNRSQEGSFRERYYSHDDRAPYTNASSEYPYYHAYREEEEETDRHHYPYGRYHSSNSHFPASDPRVSNSMSSRRRLPQLQHVEVGGEERRLSREFLERAQLQRQPSQRQATHSRPKQQQPQQQQHYLEVEIAPGVMERLRGADETALALEQGRVVGSDCVCCGARSLCIDDASYLLCPICKVVNPLRSDRTGGVGLGILAEQY